MNRTDACRWHRYGTTLFLFLAALLGVAPAAAQTSLPEIHGPQAQLICSDSGVNTDAWLSGIAIAQPGRWWNPKRYGTGWDFVYNDDRTHLKAFLYTFNANGHSTWLATKMTHIVPGSEQWRATIWEYRKNGSTITPTAVGEVVARFFRDDPSRMAVRWRWDAIPSNLLPSVGYAEECLSDMTRLNPTYYAGNDAPVTQEFYDKEITSEPVVNQIFSGYWNNSGNPPVVDEVPGVVMTLMQVSLGPERGNWGEAAVRLTFNNAPVGDPNRGAPVFVQAQRVALASNIPLTSDTFNLYYHYGVGYPNGFPLNDCPTSIGCNNNQLIGTYTRYFRPETNYREAHTTFFVDPTKLGSGGTVPGAPAINGVTKPTYLVSGSDVAPVKRTHRLQEISVNQYVCQAPVGGNCAVWVSWAGNGIGKPWKRDLATITYGAAPIDTADFGVSQQLLAHGERVQFELWQGTPGTAGAVLLDKAPEVRAVGPTPSETGRIDVPPAPVISNLADLPEHNYWVGALAGEADVSGGAATYTVPIQLPPGRNGMQPQVSLSYSSRGGNGAAGLGWSLNAGSSIARCAKSAEQDGISRGVSMNFDDRLCLDGQRLVGVAGTYGQANAEYRTEIESFARIRQNGIAANLGSGEVCFTVEYKDGRKATYGCLPASYACNAGAPPRLQPAGLTREHSWLVSRVEDAAGNTMDYCYSAGEPSGGEIVLDQIRYTGSVLAAPSAVTTPNRIVDFDYEPRPADGRANDRGSSGVAGAMLHQTLRLKTITTYSPDSVHPARRYVLDYFDPLFSGLTYSHYSGRSLLRRITECAYKPGNGAESCRGATEFTWSDGTWEFASRKLTVTNGSGRSPSVLPPAPMPAPLWQEGSESATAPVYRRHRVQPLGDLDGDGTREVLVTTSWYDGGPQYETQLSKVTADRATQGIVTLTGFSEGRVADIDGDGIAEIVSGNKIYKYTRGRGVPLCDGGAATCTAGASSYFQTVTAGLPAEERDFLESLADFNGDGAPDALVRRLPGSACDLSSGSGSEKAAGTKGILPGGQAPLCLFLNSRPGPILPGTTTYSFTVAGAIGSVYAGGVTEFVQHVADVDGNGAADVVIADANGVQRLLMGKVSSAGGLPTFAAQLPATLGLRPYTKNLRWMDINGDGFDDAVIADVPGGSANCPGNSCYATWVLQLNRGGSFGASIYPSSPAGYVSPGLSFDTVGSQRQLRYYDKMIQTDVDSDGRADLLYPAHFAARMCFGARVTANQCIGDVEPEDCTHGICDATACATPPPEDGSAFVANPVAGKFCAVDAYRSGLGGVDPSVYRYNAIRFVQTGADTFRLQVDETPIVAGTSQLGNQRGSGDDYFGDGLADVVADAGCPLLPTEDFPNNTCLLFSGGNQGPGSPTSYLDTAQTIQLGQLTDPANINLVLNENLGDGARSGLAPMFPDMMGKAANALGDVATWDYFPLSSSAGRGSGDFPLYKIDASYVDARHFLFQSSMPVVSVLARVTGASPGQTLGGRSVRYAYEGAMYNANGRGFQGFRRISTEAVAIAARVVRSVTTFHQKFPLTGRIEQIETRLPNSLANSRLSLETFDWRCNRANTAETCPGQSGSAPAGNTIHWPFLHGSTKRVYDLFAAGTGSQLQIGIIDIANAEPNTSVSGWTAEGNLRYQRTVRRDGNGTADGDKFYLAGHETVTVNTYDTSAGPLGQWWLDKLADSTTTTSVSYLPRSGDMPTMDLSPKTVVTSYAWNTNRTLVSKTVTDPVALKSLTTAQGYPTPNLGLPSSITVSGDGIAPTREVRTDYTADGYFPATVTGVLSASQPALNHVTTSVVRASDGQPNSVTDPAGLKVVTSYDVFGFATRKDFYKTDGVTPLRPPTRNALSAVCLPCGAAGPGEEMAVYSATTVQDGAPTVRIWYDLLNREVKRATRGFDGRWVNATTKYESMGQVLQVSAPYFDGETPLLTQFTYDRLNRMRTKRVPTAELNAAQGDLQTIYNHSGLRTDMTVGPVSGNCTTSPHLCFTLKRHTNTLGQLMRTEDALANTYPGNVLGGITDFWHNPQGSIAAIRDGKGSVTAATYNAFGHRLTSSDPNQGNWSFSYNMLGELVAKTDPRGVQTSVTQRDGLGRPLQQRREPSAGVPASLANEKVLDTWQYDIAGVKGAIASQQRQRSLTSGSPDGSAPVWKESYYYDLTTARLAQRKTEMEQAAPGPLTLDYFYQYDDYYGYPSAITYPNAPQPLTVWKRYSRYGAPSGLVDARLMTPMWSMSEADAYGKPTREQFGYTFYGQASYSRATGQMRSQSWRPYEVPTFEGNLDEFAYTYDVLGNLASQERKWRRYEENTGYLSMFSILSIGADKQGRTLETYSYDQVQRLTGVNRTRRAWSEQSWTDVPANPATVSYGYDAVGNILAKSDYADSYTYGGNPGDSCGPNAVKTIYAANDGAPQTRSFQCDANGNQIGETGSGPATHSRTLVYDGANLPTRILHTDVVFANAEIKFAYGPGNARYMRTGDNRAVYYGADGYEREVAGGETLHRIELGPVVYTRQVSGSTASPAVTSYQIRDRLGSTIGVADRLGNFNGSGYPVSADGLLRRSYDPFGMPREAGLTGVYRPMNYSLPTLQLGPATRRGFTGHEHIDTAKLIHMNGRVYDYRTGRFLSADPFIAYPGNSQGFNPYSYILNNPLSASDPSGYTPDCSIEDKCAFTGADIVAITIEPATEDSEAYAVAHTGDGGLFRIDTITVITASENGSGVEGQDVYEAGKSDPSELQDLASRHDLKGITTTFSGTDYIREQSNRHGRDYLYNFAKIGFEGAKCRLAPGQCAIDVAEKILGVSLDTSLRQMPVIEQSTQPRQLPPGVELVPPDMIRFSQSSVTGSGWITDSMQKHGWQGEPIDIVRMRDGVLTTFDNTRLLAASRAGIDTEAAVHDYDDPFPGASRWTSKKGVVPATWGEAVHMRIGQQNRGYRDTYPNGSPATGSTE